MNETTALDTEARARQSLGSSSDVIYRMVERVLDESGVPRGGDLLDVGCGGGKLWPYVRPRFASYTGVDVLAFDGFPAEGRFVALDLDTGGIPLPDASYDVVASVETIEHLDGPRKFVAGLTRLVKPGGWLIITTPNQLTLYSLLSLLIRGYFSAFHEAPGLYPAHITALLETDVLRMLRENGLVDARVAYSNRGRIPLTPFHWPWPLRGRRFSENLAVIARKPLAAGRDAPMSDGSWHIFTGEYPPVPGGVGDYSALLASGLASHGAEVHVWTVDAGGRPTREADKLPGVTAHRVGGKWSPADLARIGLALDALPAPRRLVVQYTPNAYGYKGLNVGFCRWLIRRKGRGDEVRVMFHEVAVPYELWVKPTRWVLSTGQRWMARLLLKASRHVDMSTPAWEATLRHVAPGDRRQYHWRPVPSNVPVVDDPVGVARLRAEVAPNGETIVGSFGTFPGHVREMLIEVLPSLLAERADRVGLFIGRNGERMAAEMVAASPGLEGRLVATGGRPPSEVSRYLQACDVVVQPFPDGITSRRGSVMGAIAHGTPTVTNHGRLTEPIWGESGGVGLAKSPRAADVIEATERLLGDAGLRRRVGEAGRALYERRFAVDRTVEALVGVPSSSTT